MAERKIGARPSGFVVVDGKDGFWDRYEAGTWEPETLAAVRRLARPGVTLVDIGGWIGPISLTALGLGARVVAFEPDPRAHELFAANLSANPAFAGRASLHHRAVSPHSGRLKLGSPKKLGDSMGSVLLADDAVATFDAEAVSPAEVLSLAGAGPLLVKIDIEGGEYDLLPLAGALLGPGTRAALVAFHPRLLARSGADDASVAARTVLALAPLAGFGLRILDGETLTEGNVTALFERPEAS